MGVKAATRVAQRGMVLSVCCDVCRDEGEGTVDELHERGWFFEGVTPHACPACAEIRERHLHGDLVPARSPRG